MTYSPSALATTDAHDAASSSNVNSPQPWEPYYHTMLVSGEDGRREGLYDDDDNSHRSHSWNGECSPVVAAEGGHGAEHGRCIAVAGGKEHGVVVAVGDNGDSMSWEGGGCGDISHHPRHGILYDLHQIRQGC